MMKVEKSSKNQVSSKGKELPMLKFGHAFTKIGWFSKTKIKMTGTIYSNSFKLPPAAAAADFHSV